MKKKFDLERINRIFTVFLCLTMFMNFLPIGVWAEMDNAPSTSETAPGTPVESTQTSPSNTTSTQETTSSSVPETTTATTSSELATPAAARAPAETVTEVPAAAEATLTGTVTDDNGVVDVTSATTDQATFSLGAVEGKTYPLNLQSMFPAGSKEIQLSIQLPEGLKWADDGKNYQPLLDLLADGANSIETVPLPSTVSSSLGGTIRINQTNTGTRNYTFKDGVTDFNLGFKIQVDTQFRMKNLKQPVKTVLSYQDNQGNERTQTITLDKIQVNDLAGVVWSGGTGGDQLVTAGQPLNYIGNPQVSRGKWTLQYNWKNIEYQAAIEKIQFDIEMLDGESRVKIDSSQENQEFIKISDNHYYLSYTLNRLSGGGMLPIQVLVAEGTTAGTIIPIKQIVKVFYYGGEVSEAVNSYNLIVNKPEEYVFVQYNNLLKDIPTTAREVTLTGGWGQASPFDAEDMIGEFSLGNKGGVDSVPKYVEMHFEDTQTGVTGLQLPIGKDKILTSIQYQATGSNDWQTVNGLSLKGDSNGLTVATRQTLGITDERAYIKAIKYQIETIPSGFIFGYGGSGNHFRIYGVTKVNRPTNYTYTIQVYDVNGDHDTGIGKVTISNTNKIGRVTINSTSIPNASIISTGEIIHQYLQIKGSGYMPDVIEHPIIWLKSLKDLPISNIRLTDRDGQPITAQDGLIVSYNQQLDNSDYCYTKIDTSYCKAYQVQLGIKTKEDSIVESGLVLDWDIETTANSPIGTYYYKDMIYIDSLESSGLSHANNSNAIDLHKPTNIIPGITRNLVGISPNLADRYFQIKEAQGLTVSTAAKSVAAEEYAPVTANHPILVNNTADGASNIKVDVRNNTDAQLDTPQVIYVPIPKEGEKWGNNPAFQFSMTLTQAVQAAASLGGTVEYGVGVTPKDNASELAAQAAKFSSEVDDLSTVNCIKITTGSIPAKSTASYILTAKVAGSTPVDDGLVNAWAPIYHQSTNVGSYDSQGAMIYAETAYGEVEGRFFDDKDGDGVKETGEGWLSDTRWQVDLLTKDGHDTVLASTHINASGEYHFKGIRVDQTGSKYYLRITNPEVSAKMFARVPSTQPTAENVLNAAMGVYDAENDQAPTGVINLVKTAAQNDLTHGNGIYYVGVTNIKRTTLTFKAVKDNETILGTLSGNGVQDATELTVTGLPIKPIPAITTKAATNYLFSHWAKDQTGTQKIETTDFGEKGLLGTTNQTYYALFAQSTFTIRYLPGTQGDFATQVKTGTNGQATPAFEGTPKGKAGWYFNGWSPTVASTVTKNQDYTAQWVKGGQVTFTGTKVLKEGDAVKAFTAGQFQAKIAADSANDTTGYTGFTSKTIDIPASGTFSFDAITFTKAGTYKFVINEVDGKQAGYTYDAKPVTATVKVTLDADNVLKPTVTYKKDGQTVQGIAFNNTYTTPTAIDVTLQGTKKLTENNQAKAFTAGQFQAKIVADSANDTTGYTGFTSKTINIPTNGNFSFDTIHFNKVGTYRFTISEVNGQATGYTYDGLVVEATVKVSLDQATNKLTSVVTYKKNGETVDKAVFNNTYIAPKATKVTFTGTKVLKEGNSVKAFTAGQFQAKIAADSANDTTGYTGFTSKTIDIPANGTFNFDTIAFTKAGTYTFTISEVNGQQAGYTYDAKPVTAKVTVTLGSDNTLVPSVTYTKDNKTVESIVFTNQYATPTATDVTFTGTKKLTENNQAKAFTAGQFQAKIVADSANDTTGYTGFTSKTINIPANGNFSFDPIHFNKVGTYRFTISEVNGQATGYTYDGQVVEATVKVSLDQETNKLVSAVTYKKNGETVEKAVFNNMYIAPKATKVTFTGTKVLKEGNIVKTFTAGQFQAKIVADSANDTTGYTGFTNKTIDIPASGTFSFDAITFTKAGTYKFVINEVDGKQAGYTYDAKPVTAKVTVTLGSDNTLVPSVTYTKDNKTVESIAFTNQYATPTATDVTFTGTKKLTENNQAKAFTASQFQAKIVADSANDATGYTGFTNAETIDIPANGNFSFDPIHFNKVGTYRFILTEVNGAKAGYTYDALAIEAIVKVDLDQTTNKLTSTVTYKKNSQVVNQAVFNNTYTTPSPSVVTLTGTKTLTENDQAKVMSKDQFHFTVTPDKNNPAEGYTGLITTTVGNEANGSFSFGTLNFTKVGTYKFVISEVDGQKAGYTYDVKPVTVKVVVTLGEDNVLHPTVTYEKAGQTVQGIAFNNTYTTPTAIGVTLQGTKKLIENNQAKAFTAGQFQAKIVADSANDTTGYTGFSNEKMIGIPANGNFSFEPIHFNKVGTYRFTISEVNGQATGYTYDGLVVEATVKVSLDQTTNKLVSTVTYKKNGQAIEQAVFNNTYTAPSPTTITLTGTKVLKEGDIVKTFTAGQFQAKIAADSANDTTGYTGFTNKTIDIPASGTFSFDAITFTKAGTYTFTISEVNGQQAGYTYDTKPVTAKVTVTLGSDNTLVPSVTYTKDNKTVESIAFTNQYATPTATDVTFTGTKKLTENNQTKAFTAGQFQAKIVADSTNDTTGYTGFTNAETIDIPANGNFSFDPIHFNKVGTYRFTISEVNGQATGYTYDNFVVEATVKVSLDQATNKLTSTVTYKKNGQDIEQAVFNNTYTAPSPTTITLTGTKFLKEGDTAKSFTAGQFQFTVTPDKDNPADGYTGLAETTVGNEANGSFSFGTLNFTKVGTYKFVISEVDGQKAGYTYDDKPVTATVKVALGEDNVLHPTVTYEKDGQSAEAIAFTNTYTTPSAVSLHLTGQKALTGQKDTKDIQANQFHFTVSGDRNRKVGVQAGGTIDFGTFSFTSVGTYRLTIQEENLGQAGYTYDTSRYDWVVNVSLNETTNRLEATSQLTKDGQAVSAVTFTNHYQAKSVVVSDPPIEKTVIGQPTTPAAFSFVMTATNPAFPMPTGSVNGEKTMTRIGAGRVEFGDITFTEAGTYTYVLQEKNLATPGYAYDQRSYLVTYDVTDKDGQLTVTRTIEQAGQTVTQVLFTNVYTAPILPNTGGNPSAQDPGKSSTNTQSTNPTARSLLPNTGTNPTVSKVVQQPTPTTNRLPKTGNSSSAAYVWVGIMMIVLSGMSCLLYYRNHRKMNRP